MKAPDALLASPVQFQCCQRSWGYFLDKTCRAFCLIEVPAIGKFAVAMDGKETTELHLDDKDEEQKANGNFLIPESRMSCPCKFL